MAETLLLGTGLYLLCLLIFVIPGVAAAGLWLPQLDSRERLLAAPVLTTLLLGALISLGLLFGVTNSVLGIFFLLISVAGLSVLLAKRDWQALQFGAPAFGVMLLYYLLITVGASFPDGNYRNVTPSQVLLLTSLPVDNVLPYLFSRYVVERIAPAGHEIFPTWGATDRPPLAALLNAAIFFVLDLKDTTTWLNASRGLYFVYQCVQGFLNTLCLIPVWVLAVSFGGRRAGYVALLLVISTYFFYQNTLFTWPKLFMAYGCLAGLYFWYRSRSAYFAGMSFAMGALAHNSITFYFVAFVGMLGTSGLLEWRRGRNLRSALSPVFQVVLSYFVLMLPWTLYKQFIEPPSPRLVYLHLFCNYNYDISGLTFFGEFQRYFSETPLSRVLEIRWSNLLYPFEVGRVFRSLSASWPHLMLGLHGVSEVAFYQLVWGIGIIPCSLALLTLLNCDRGVRALVGVSAGALLVAVLAFGCTPATMTHHWGYPAFLTIAIVAALTAVRSGIYGALLVGVAVGTNIVWLCLRAGFQEQLKVFLHQSSMATAVQIVLLTLTCLVCVLGWRRAELKEE